MRRKTGVHWLDAYVEQAEREGVPETIDRESGRLLYGRILQQDVPMKIYRRLAIPYVVIHGRARQRPGDVITAAKQVFAEAPLRCGSRSPSHQPDKARGAPGGKTPASKHLPGPEAA
jgi:hypothetical protein